MVGYGWAYNDCTCGSSGTSNGCTPGWLKYWQIQNSWGRGWGNGGYFRIRRGVDEARIESWAATAPSVDVTCENNNNYYGGEINYPNNFDIFKVPFDSKKYPEKPDDFDIVVDPIEPKSAQCKAAHWEQKIPDHMGPFKTVHNINDVRR